MSGSDLAILTPLFLAGGAIVTYFAGKALRPERRRWVGTVAAGWQGAAFVLLLLAAWMGIGGGDMFNLLHARELGLVIGLLATGIGTLATIASQSRLDPTGPVHLYYPLLVFAIAGTVAVGFAVDLFTLFVMVELTALPSYALVAYLHREERRAISAALKYLFQGVAGTITALFGVALLFVLARGGTLRIEDLAAALAGKDPTLVALGAGLILVGYGVKLGIVPMHTWLPDAYTYAPAGVTAIMAGATKAAALLALFRSFVALPTGAVAPETVGIVVGLLAVVTMTVGNLLALNQKDLRRLLAYSSVAQMGYLLLGFAVGLQYGIALGFAAGLFYAIAYGVMKSGAFLCADLLANAAGSPEIANMKGLGARHPVIGIAFTLFVLGLVGVPATAGFPGKLLLFQAGMATSSAFGIALALALAFNSALSLGYYVPVLSTLLFQGEKHEAAKPERFPLGAAASVIVLAVVTVVLGLFPQLFFGWIDSAAVALAPGGFP